MKRSEWFDVSDEKTVARLRSHIERGTKYVIADLTSVEPVTYIERLDRFDIEKFPFDDVFYVDFTLFGTCLEMEKAQICGFRLVADCSKLPLSVFASLSITDVLDWTRALVACPGRYKQSFIVNLPPIAMKFYNIASMILPEKLRKRLILVKDFDELRNYMDVSKLPRDFGGNGDEEGYIQESLKIFDENLKYLSASNDYEIDLNKVSFKVNENTGSFRKLEID